ncbi:MAG: N-6 DNA methylase [Candidatus Obscuribacterales bacterium]|nr:N-6 DNA methylase [Candidatus Obscuribacterales bacterium]
MHSTDSRQNLQQLKKMLGRMQAVYWDEVDQNKTDRWQCFSYLLQLLCLKKLVGSDSHITLDLFAVDDFCSQLRSQIAVLLPDLSVPLSARDISTSGLQRLLSILDTTSSVIDRLDERCLGYAYQLFCQESRSETLQSIQTANKNSSEQDVISFTQLYTPDWIADYLINACLEEKDTHTLSVLESLKILDPACGSGHILLRLVDKLSIAYEKQGLSPRDSFLAVCRNNICGTDIDPAALLITGLALWLKVLRAGVSEPMTLPLFLVNEGSEGLGSLHKHWPDGHPLGRKYDAVIANPPYLGRKLLDRNLKEKLRTHYPNSCHDLSAAFLERSFALLNDSGRLGFVTQASLLYLPSYESLRAGILEKHELNYVVELASQAFPLQKGEKVNSILFVASKSKKTVSQAALFIDLRQHKNKLAALTAVLSGEEPSAVYRVNQNDFTLQRRQAFNYRCPPFLARIFQQAHRLEDIAEIKQGLATTDNARFLRKLEDVPEHEIGHKWFPYVKGAGSVRWWSPVDTVVLWENNGAAIKAAVEKNYPYLNGRIAWVVKNERYYFKPGLTFSFVNSRQLAIRELPGGCIFDVAGSSLFCEDSLRLPLLAYLNSSFVALCASTLNPTINFQVGDLKLLPLLNFSTSFKEELSSIADRCLSIVKAKNDRAELHQWERKLDALVIAEVEEQFSLREEEKQLLAKLCAQQAESRSNNLDALSRNRLSASYNPD